jgi:integrase
VPKRKRGNNEGSIYKMQDGRWRAAVSVGKDPFGKLKVKVFTAPTRHEVQGQLTKALRDLQLGIPIVNDNQTTAHFLKHWLEQVVKARVRPATLRTYSDLVKNHISPAIGAVPIGKLSPAQIREFLNAKLAAGFSPRTVKHVLVTLRGALGVAVKDGQIARNVAALVDAPRVPRRDVHAFNPDQARAFIEAVHGHRLEAVFTAALAVGLRQGEILGLQWTDVNLETGVLTVTGALQRVAKKLVRVEPKSATSRRSIQLPAVC